MSCLSLALECRRLSSFVEFEVVNKSFTRPYSSDSQISVTPYSWEKLMGDTTKNDTAMSDNHE